MKAIWDRKFFAVEYGGCDCECEHCWSLQAGSQIASATSLDALVRQVARQVPEDALWDWHRRPECWVGEKTLGEITHPAIHGYIQIRERLGGERNAVQSQV